MAFALLSEHQYAKAVALMEDINDLSERLGLHNYHAVGVHRLGDAAFRLGRYGDALAAFKQAEALFKSTQTPFWSYQSLCFQARIYTRKDEQLKALSCLQEGIRFVKGLSKAQYCKALLAVAEYVNAYHSPVKAVTILQCLINHPQIWKRDKDQVVELIAQLKNELSPEAFQTGVKASRFYTLELLVEEALLLTA
jgi:tetratricopeptide (TPR) repeat protein